MKSFAQPLDAVGGHFGNVAFGREAVAQGHAQVFFIFHQKDALVHARKSGSGLRDLPPSRRCSRSTGSEGSRWIMKELPLPNSLSPVRRPPISSTIFRARASPSPVP